MQLSRLRSKLRENEEALSHARKSTHNATMDKQEVGRPTCMYVASLAGGKVTNTYVYSLARRR